MVKGVFKIILLNSLLYTSEAMFDLPQLLDFQSLAVKRYGSRNRASKSERLPVLDFVGLVKRHGYPAEEHMLKTPDGYQLRFHRIPGSPTNPKTPGKPVVYIQHGILASSDLFVVAGPDKDLAFMLAGLGYDVWLGNGRGNTYGRSHAQLSPDDPEFWKFSWHEIAVYDVSSTIDYILHETNQSSVVYVAHSMGSTIGLVLLAYKPEYNEKISVVINMATIGMWKKPRNIMKFFKTYGHIVQSALVAARINEVFPQSLGGTQILNGTCRDGSIFQVLCTRSIHYVCGYNPDPVDNKILVEGLSYFPAGTSTQTLSHFYQNIVSGKLRMFDYGVIRNFMTYGQFTPPSYNLKNIEVPVVLIYGKGDAVATSEDSLDLIRSLKNAKAESVPHDYFGHLDFVWSSNVKRLVHDRVMDIIQRSSSSRKVEDL